MPKQKVVRDAGTGQFVKPEEAKEGANKHPPQRN